MDVDQYVSERQGLRLERSSDLGGVARGTSDLGLGSRKVARSKEERPLTLSKAASRGLLLPKTVDADEADGTGGKEQVQGEQGKLLLEVETQYHNLIVAIMLLPGLLGRHF